MGDKVITGIVGILTAIIGVAIVAVLVSSKSQTSQVIGAGGSAFSAILNTALSPVSGGGGGFQGLSTALGNLNPNTVNLSYPFSGL